MAEILSGFTSAYVSLYKEVGALGGAVLLGDTDFIDTARKLKSQMGGLLVEPWPYIANTLSKLEGFESRLAKRCKKTRK